MTDDQNLQALLAALHPELRAGEYVYVLWPHGTPLAAGIEAAVREAEGLTVVLPRTEADRLGLRYDFVAAWITLQVHSELEAVGLTAEVGKALTDARISCNVLAGFHHDHLLVPVADAPRALEALAELSAASRHQPRPELLLRNETMADRDKILALTAEAFAIDPSSGLPVEGEPKEVEVLRRLFACEEYLPEFSVVAVMENEVVGHVISTRGLVGEYGMLGLGPIGVAPRLQRHGIGTALIKDTIARANVAREGGIAVLGSTDYYQRFGFIPAASFGIRLPEDSWGEEFQLLPLAVWPGGIHGTFRYAGPLEEMTLAGK